MAKQQVANGKQKKKIKGRVGRAALTLGGQAVKGALKGAQGYGKLLLTGASAGLGLVFAATSGDPSNVLKYGGAGFVAGNAATGRFPKLNDVYSKKSMEDVRRAYYGKDYKHKMVEEQEKEYIKSKKNIQELGEYLGIDDKEAKEIHQDFGTQCFENGINNVEDEAAIYKLMQGDDGQSKMSFEEAVASMTYAKKRLGGASIDQMTDDQVKDYKERWASEFKARYKNLTDQQAMEMSDRAFSNAIRFNKAQGSFNKI